MTTVERAKSLIKKHAKPWRPALLPPEAATGLVTAKNLYAPIDLPPFTFSAMDGYAVRSGCTLILPVCGEVCAGDTSKARLKPGAAMRIFTGAPLPKGADSVVQQERTRDGGRQRIELTVTPVRGMHVIRKGSQAGKGSLVLKKGSLITPAAAGLLASMGIRKIPAFVPPAVSVISTGNELQKAGSVLKHGRIYESNSVALSAALRCAGVRDIRKGHATDHIPDIQKKIAAALRTSGILVLTGGISAGKYDLVRKALQKCDVRELVYKVSQKPGKPLWIGKHDDTLVFALPGNPGAALICFYEYVYPALRAMMGLRNIFLPEKAVKLAGPVSGSAERSVFMRARLMDGTAVPLSGQESFRLDSLAAADALLYLPKGTGRLPGHSYVKAHLLPQN